MLLLAATSQDDVRRAGRIALLANATSHPVFWFVVLPVVDRFLTRYPAIAVGEAIVVAYEAAIYGRWLVVASTHQSRWVTAGILSLSANLLSIGIGVLIQMQIR